ncbi:hypothetical protein V1527DRAFT_414887, partial [Lipomyces starkeyi]
LQISLMAYGYTVIGKGATDCSWKDVRRDVEVYQVLRKVQGSAVPVFMGSTDLQLAFFLHGGSCIRHMLFMSWAGDESSLWSDIKRNIHTNANIFVIRVHPYPT